METPPPILKLRVFPPQHSLVSSTTMSDAPEPRTKGMHLTDIEIAKILGLTKAKMSQRKIASLMRCSTKAVNHALVTFLFETFNGHHQRREYQRKPQNAKIDISYVLSNKTTPSRSMILPILSTIKSMSQFPRPLYDGDDQKQTWAV